MNLIEMITTNILITGMTIIICRWLWLEKQNRALRNSFSKLADMVHEKIKIGESEEKEKIPTFKSEQRKGTLSYDRDTNTVTLSGHQHEYDEKFLGYLLEYYEIPRTAIKRFTGK